jgi:hypothetical protein
MISTLLIFFHFILQILLTLTYNWQLLVAFISRKSPCIINTVYNQKNFPYVLIFITVVFVSQLEVIHCDSYIMENKIQKE